MLVGAVVAWVLFTLYLVGKNMQLSDDLEFRKRVCSGYQEEMERLQGYISEAENRYSKALFILTQEREKRSRAWQKRGEDGKFCGGKK